MSYRYEYSEMSIQLTVEGRDFTRLVPTFTVTARRGAPARMLEFEVGNVKSPAQGGLYSGLIHPGDRVELLWGLDQDRTRVFVGRVRDAQDGKTVRAWALDDGGRLGSIRTTTCTVGETTSQIVKRLAQEAGLIPDDVSTSYDVTHPHWVTSGETIGEALQRLTTTLETAYGRNVSELRWWVDGDGVFHWGPWPDVKNLCGKPLDITHQTNLIELEAPKAKGERGRVLTHAWPWFDHSQTVVITDARLARISGKEFRIEEVRHIQRGFRARTELFFKEM